MLSHAPSPLKTGPNRAILVTVDFFSSTPWWSLSIIGWPGKMSPDHRFDSFGCMRLAVAEIDHCHYPIEQRRHFLESPLQYNLGGNHALVNRLFMPIIHSKYVAFHLRRPLTGSRKLVEIEQGYNWLHFLSTCPSVLWRQGYCKCFPFIGKPLS